MESSKGKSLPPGELMEPPAVVVGHDGKIDGIYRPRDSRRSWDQTDQAHFELVSQKRPEAPAPDLLATRGTRRPSRKAIGVLALALVGTVLLPLAGRWVYARWTDYQDGLVKGGGLIVIDSRPSSARVFVNGTEVGRTPWVAPNTFRRGTVVPVRIVYSGAQEWTGTLPGGVDTSFTAELQAEE